MVRRLAEPVAVLVTANEVVKGKPDPAIFFRVAKHLSLERSNLLVVEDANSGVKAGKSAGMRCVGIASEGPGDKLKQAGADYVIPDYRGISVFEVQQLFKDQAAVPVAD